MIRHVALDLDGTLYRDGVLFPATKPFLAGLTAKGIGYTFLTNNTSLSKKDYVVKLRKLGLEADEASVATPADATLRYLKETLKAKRVALLGTPSLASQFEEAGFIVDWENPDAVVVGFDMTLNYDKLCRTAWWISQGKPFLATHPDRVCPTALPTVLVDCGAICACLTAATGVEPTVFGKPNASMLEEIARQHSLKMNEIAMVGDRLYTDIVMATNAGALAVLVLTGEATKADLHSAIVKPDMILNDVGELLQSLEQTQSGVDPCAH